MVATRTKHIPKEDNSTMATSCQVSYKSAKCCPPAYAGMTTLHEPHATLFLAQGDGNRQEQPSQVPGTLQVRLHPQ